MTSKRVRAVLVTVLAGAVGATALAQRGGYRAVAPAYNTNVKYDGRFVFVRMSYPWYGRRQPYWSHDYPYGEEHFMKILTAVSNVQGHVMESSIMAFSDPEIFKFPVIYLCEPGYWALTDDEVKALRAYLLKGGFMIVDDFRYQAWGNFSLVMSRVFPEGRFVDLDASHPVFHSFFDINAPNAIPQYYDPGQPIFRGLFVDNDPKKRMMVMVNYNTDISEFWEWSDTGFKPMDETNDAYKIGVNEFIYGITH